MLPPNQFSKASTKSASSSDSSTSSTDRGSIKREHAPTEPVQQPEEKAKPEFISVKITTPNFTEKRTKVFEFDINSTVWRAKQDVLLDFAHCKELKDPLNFGFYMPPQSGRAGKFLMEERLLKEYPMERANRHLEFRYKRRIFRHLQLTDEKKLQKINTKKHRKKFIEQIFAKDLLEITNVLQRGLDPNYHDDKSGDTPLIIASLLDDSAELLKVLVQYGAYLDFRSEAGYTALHNVAMIGRIETLEILLDLGASPNYKDAKGLTPLYYSISQSSNPLITELLLNERAEIGIADINGVQEIHLACKLGHIQHLEHLIYYGADVNCRTASGSTPLHICAVENRESCARVLLFRGANKNILNFAQQSPHDVAIVSNHFEIATLIIEFKEKDAKLFSDKPTYSKRRGAKPVLIEGKSLSPKTSSSSEPSSPTPGLQRASSETNMNAVVSMLKRKSSTNSLPTMLEEYSETESDSDEEETVKVPRRPLVNAGVGTKRSPAPMKIKNTAQVHLRNRLYSSVPGRQFVAILDYTPAQTGELALEKGDIVEVLYVGEQGFWEGRVRGRAGWFPSYCVQETTKGGKNQKAKQKSWFSRKSTPIDVIDKAMKVEAPKERVVHLKRSDKGFGFQLRGANSHTPRIEFSPTPQYPALQYIGEVDKGGVAEKAGLKPGDFVLEINNENIVNGTHSYAVSIIANGGDELQLKVITVAPETISPELLLQNGTLRSKDVREVKESLKDAGLMDENKKPPPPPPIRSSSTVLTQISTEHGESVFSEASVDTTAETVVLDKSNDRKSSVKGMWAGSAYKLHGEEVKIREENISTGMGRKQKAVSVDLAKEFEEKFKQITKPVQVDSSLYPPIKPKPTKENISKVIDNDSDNARKSTPPDYEYTLESLRRGRANSIGKGDNVRPRLNSNGASTRPTSMIITSNTDFMNGQKFSGPPRKNSREKYPENSSRSQLYANADDLALRRSTQRVDSYLEEQQYATVKRHNRYTPSQPPNNANFRPPNPNGRPQSATIDRNYQKHYRDDDPRVNNLFSRLSQMDPTQTLPSRLNKTPLQQETPIQAHQRQLYNQEINYQYHEIPTVSPHHQGQNDNSQPADGLLRLQNERNQRNQQRQSLPTHQIKPAPSFSNTSQLPGLPVPPTPPPDYFDAETSDHQVEHVGTKLESPSSAFENSIANAAAAHASRMKEESLKKEDRSGHRNNSITGSESLSLYNSSSSVSLDSTCSKDSGIDNSSEVEHSSVLAHAIAQRAAKLSSKENPSLSTTVEETNDDAAVKPSDIKEQNERAISLTLEMNDQQSEEDKGYSSPTTDRSRSKLTSNLPPTVKPKPKRNVNKFDKNNNSPALSEAYATTLLDGVIADAEASIDYDLISISSATSLPDDEKVDNTPVEASHPPVAPKPDNLSTQNTAMPKDISQADLQVDLPPPPMEFLDTFAPEVTSETKPAELQSIKVAPEEPPYPPPSYTALYKNESKPADPNIPESLSGKPYMEWTISDVGLWLEKLDLGQYKQTFTDNDIEGKHLPDLSKDELKELGIKKLGHRMTLDDAISKLCRKT